MACRNLTEGTNGRQWEFQASIAWAWKCARDEGEREKNSQAQAAIAAMRLALIGGKSGSSIQSLPPKERQMLYDVEASFEKLKRERNQSLDRDETMAVFNDLMRIVRDGCSALPDTLEREASLDGKVCRLRCVSATTSWASLSGPFTVSSPTGRSSHAKERRDLFN